MESRLDRVQTLTSLGIVLGKLLQLDHGFRILQRPLDGGGWGLWHRWQCCDFHSVHAQAHPGDDRDQEAGGAELHQGSGGCFHGERCFAGWIVASDENVETLRVVAEQRLHGMGVKEE